MKLLNFFIPAALAITAFLASFFFQPASRTIPAACVGKVSRTLITESGKSQMTGLMTLQFNGPDAGRARFSGRINDTSDMVYYINRLASFNFVPEGQGKLVLAQITSLEKSADDNVPDRVFAHFSLLGSSRTYLGLYRPDPGIVFVTENGIPYLVCNSAEAP